MPVTVRKLYNEPILLLSLRGNITLDDMRGALAQGLPLVAQQHERVFMIRDMRETWQTLQSLDALWQAARRLSRLDGNHYGDNIVELGVLPMRAVGAFGMADPHLHALNIPLFADLRRAIEYARAWPLTTPGRRQQTTARPLRIQ